MYISVLQFAVNNQVQLAVLSFRLEWNCSRISCNTRTPVVNNRDFQQYFILEFTGVSRTDNKQA